MTFGDLAAPLPPQNYEQPKTELAVVLLAGGFASELVKDLKSSQATQKVNAQDKRPGQGLLVLRGEQGNSRIPLGLLPLNERPALMYWMRALMKCQRIQPIREYVYIVCNEIDIDEIIGKKGLIDDMGANINFCREHVLSNGCMTASEWQGELQDLKVAIQHLGFTRNILAISCSCVVWPEYNFQRILEHPIVRGTNVIAYSRLTQTDQLLHQGPPPLQVQVVDPSMPVPSVKLVISEKQLVAGDLAANPIAWLQARCLTQIYDLKLVGLDLPQVVAALAESGNKLSGIDMEWGRFHLHRKEWMEYTDQFFYWYYKTSQQLFSARKIFNANDTDFVLGDDIGELGPSKRLDRREWATLLIEQLGGNPATDFDKVYFGRQQAAEQGGRFYVLPKDFYVTTVQKQNEKVEELHRTNQSNI